MKNYVKPTQEKQPAQIIINGGTNDLLGNKTSAELANEIVEFANSINTSENNVIVSSLVSWKDQFNNKANEVNENLKDKCEEHNLQLIKQHGINPFRHTNEDKQSTKNFTSFIKNG